MMDTKAKPAAKEKRRNNEKRKEKSRDAARCRRSRETEIFTDLANALPITNESAKQLDKASIMRLAISFLRIRDMIGILPDMPPSKESASDESVFLQALEGFLLVVSPDGELIYLSENVSDYLGISQIDLMGQNVYEYSHPCDHEEIKEILASKSGDGNDEPKSFFLRLKCTLTSKGRSVNLKSATYKVIHCTGHIQTRADRGKGDEKRAPASLDKCLVAIGRPIPHPSNIEIPLDKKTFLTKHSLDMKFTYADEKMLEVLGYEAEDLIGSSVYGYHHAMDSDSICSDFKSLFSKGQCETGQYRFLAKTGGFVWVVTQATLIQDKMQKPQSVVCVNYVVSGVECKDEIYSCGQLSSVKNERIVPTSPAPQPSTATVSAVVKAVAVVPPVSGVVDEPGPDSVEAPGPELAASGVLAPALPPPRLLQTATSKLFAPRTEDMSKGFLMWSDEEPGLTISFKDEPDDLTHLAPEAGDVCVPLDDNPLLSDMLNDFLGSNYCPLFPDDLHSLDSECSKNSDPFISYHEEFDDATNSPHLLSPALSKSPECIVPSISSPGNSLGEDDHLNTFISLQMDDDDSQLKMKAPYVSMSGSDDFPLLNSNDLMWNAIPNQKVLKSHKTPDLNSSLAHLLCSTVNKPGIKVNDHGGGIIERNKTKDTEYEVKSKTEWNSKSHSLYQPADKPERTGNKRTYPTSYDASNKRTKHEPKEKLSSELLQQLISNNHQRQRTKTKSNWLVEQSNKTTTCISQPSDSVLMNLLGGPLDTDMETQIVNIPLTVLKRARSNSPDERRKLIRKNSCSLLDPDAAIPSLLDLTQQDYEVNAPVNSFLLQGHDLIQALELNEGLC